jgi:hypothetical protein
MEGLREPPMPAPMRPVRGTALIAFSPFRCVEESWQLDVEIDRTGETPGPRAAHHTEAGTILRQSGKADNGFGGAATSSIE